MNNKLVFLVAFVCAVSFLGAIYAGESSGSGSSSKSGAAAQEQLCTICQETIMPGEALADGRELFGCPHVFHKSCLYDEHGEPRTHRCPLCRATKDPDTAQDEADALRHYAYQRDLPDFAAVLAHEAAAQAPAVVLPSLANVARPAAVSELVWQKAVDSLNESHNTKLDLSDSGLTSEQWAALIAVIPDFIKQSVLILNLSDPQGFGRLTSIPGLENFVHLHELYAWRNKLMNLPLGMLTELQKLDISENKLTALPGLENLVHLHELYAKGNDLTSLSLGMLTELQKLDISENKLTALLGLENLVHLQELHACRNRLPSLPLATLTELQKLEIWSNKLIALPGLENLVHLRELGVGGNKLIELPGLGNLRLLTVLSADVNNLKALIGLENLTQLKYLNVGNNKLTDLPGLKKLTQLTSLDVSNNNLETLSGLENLTQLRSLFVYENELAELPGLENLTQLTILVARDNDLMALDGLGYLTRLKTLDVGFNELTELAGLEHLALLEELYANNNYLRSTRLKAMLSKLTRLRKIDLSGNVPMSSLKKVVCPITVPEAVWKKAVNSLRESHKMRLNLSDTGLTTKQWIALIEVIPADIKARLIKLELDNNQLTELPGVEQFTHLTRLWAYKNHLKVLSGLENLSRLKSLWVSDNDLVEMSGLARLKQLEELWLHNNHLIALPGLGGLVQLTSLAVVGNPLARLCEIERLENLRDLYIDSPCEIPAEVAVRLGDGLRRISALKAAPHA